MPALVSPSRLPDSDVCFEIDPRQIAQVRVAAKILHVVFSEGFQPEEGIQILSLASRFLEEQRAAERRRGEKHD